MSEIITILMQRDGLSYDEAERKVLRAKDKALEYVMMGCFFDAEDVLVQDLGVEGEYLANMIM